MMVRLAKNSDAPHIRDLLAETAGEVLGLDWSDIYPYWLVAEKDDRVVGCINLAPSKPIGRLDFLSVDPVLGPHARGRIVRALALQGLATLKTQGCSGSISQVSFHMKPFKRILKKHFGLIVIGQGNWMLRTLQ